MSTLSIKNPLLAEWLDQTASSNEQARQITGNLSETQMNWEPPEGGWSVAMVFEHLAVTAESYFPIMTPLLQKAVAQGVRKDDYVWKPTFMGKMLYNAVNPESTRKIKAPGIFKPSMTPRDQVVAAFLSHQDTLSDMMQQADGLDLKRLRMGSPVTRLIRLNMGDCFRVMTTHARRHLLQAQRVTEHSGFPS